MVPSTFEGNAINKCLDSAHYLRVKNYRVLKFPENALVEYNHRIIDYDNPEAFG